MPLADPTVPPSDASRLSPGGKYRPLKQAGLVLLCAAWILLGLFGHDPWKPDDATTFGVAHDVLSNGDWLAFMADFSVTSIMTDFAYRAVNGTPADPAGFTTFQAYGGVRAHY